MQGRIGQFIETAYDSQWLHSALDYLTPEEYKAALPQGRPGRVRAVPASTNETCPSF
jgi:hypothetical protein